MNLRITITLTMLLTLPSCVVQATQDAMQQGKFYKLLMAQQIDASRFQVVIETEYWRGVFDPLGGHGSPYVTRRED